jgi:predicted TIM-barrel fold metal-dependent hydrolase
MIIDTHIHLPVVSENRTYQQAKEMTLEDMKLDGVSYSILIPDNVPDSEIGDLPTCHKLAEDTPELFLMGTIDIENQGSQWVAELERLMLHRQIVGMKIFPGHDPIYPTDLRLDPVYNLCRENSMPMVIHTGYNPGHPEVGKYNDPRHIVRVSERYPGLKIVIAHFFIPEVEYCYELTHDCPYIYHDTSGLADQEVVEATGAGKIETVLLKTLEADPGKVIFGTDYAMCNRKDHIDMINRLPISAEVREGIFWRNAVSVFNLPIDGNQPG